MEELGGLDVRPRRRVIDELKRLWTERGREFEHRHDESDPFTTVLTTSTVQYEITTNISGEVVIKLSRRLMPGSRFWSLVARVEVTGIQMESLLPAIVDMFNAEDAKVKEG
jgi:hypothetical protein